MIAVISSKNYQKFNKFRIFAICIYDNKCLEHILSSFDIFT